MCIQTLGTAGELQPQDSRQGEADPNSAPAVGGSVKERIILVYEIQCCQGNHMLGSLGKGEIISGGIWEGVMLTLACESQVGFAGSAGHPPAGGTGSRMGPWLEGRWAWTGRRQAWPGTEAET